MDILFFISHQPNPRFIKQLNFLAKNNKVTLVFFERETLANLNDSITKSVKKYNLGDLPNASKPVKRLLTYIKVIRKLRNLIHLGSFDVVLVNNIDVLLLYIFANYKFFGNKNKAKIAIEISDLRGFVFSNSFTSIIMRALEKKLYIKYVDKLIVTSKKYYTFHFQKFFKKEAFILENKLLISEVKSEKITVKKSPKKIIIGIVGLLLRGKEYKKLFETYKNNSTIEIHIYGKGEYQELVEEYANKYENITYFGSYNAFNDAQKIYQSIDIIYLVYDTNQTSLNNQLALPNKLYECMYYKVPIICSKETYLAEIVKNLNIGDAINYTDNKAIEQSVINITNNKSIISSFDKLPKNLYFGDEDYKLLEVFLDKK